MELINLTPHPATIAGREFAPSGDIARVSQTLTQVGEMEGIPLYVGVYGETTGLPDPQPETYCLVSGLVRAANPDRTDLASPANLIRDDAGRVIGAEGLEVSHA
jgi:hypothetical protein